MLSLARDAQNWNVDYSRDRLRGFQYATGKFIGRYRSMDIICYAHRCVHDQEQRTSWLPRFDFELFACGCQLVASTSISTPRYTATSEILERLSTYSVLGKALADATIGDSTIELEVQVIIVDSTRSVLEMPRCQKV